MRGANEKRERRVKGETHSVKANVKGVNEENKLKGEKKFFFFFTSI